MKLQSLKSEEMSDAELRTTAPQFAVDCHSAVAAVDQDDLLLITGANGFIGSWVLKTLLRQGFRNIRCLTRSESSEGRVQRSSEFPECNIEWMSGNLLSRESCRQIAQGARVVYHLAAGVEKSFPGCVMNSAVATRNLLEAIVSAGTIKRFVNISSLSVYSNAALRKGAELTEDCPIEVDFVERFDPYAYGKAKQDEIVRQYGDQHGIPYVIVRPGLTIGPGKSKIPGRVGIDTFGVFLHLGLGNQMPFTYVENCAEAIVLAGIVPGIDRQEINIVDDELPTSRTFLRRYKQRVRSITTIPVPYSLFYLCSWAWEKYSRWSGGQLPPAFNRKACEAYYKSQRFPNNKAKRLLGWRPKVQMQDALDRYCEYAGGNVVKA